jgi:MoaA/NifB/PqqE/SkfB family radical SAM enzyme
MILEKPILVIFDVTRLCNERCRMCNIWRAKSDDMTPDEIRVMAKRLAQNGISYVHLQGGDPTMRGDILEIIDIFNAVKIKPTFITNGILLKGELAAGLAKRHCNVSVSIDTLDRETFTYIRGVDKLETVIENIENAPSQRKGNWSIGCTITGLSTLEEIKRLEEFSAKNNFMFAVRPYVHNLGNAGKEDERLVYGGNCEAVAIFEYMINKARRNNYIASLIYDEGLRYVKKVMGGVENFHVCDALRRSLVMTSNGFFAPCLEFADEALPLENLLKNRKTWLTRCVNCNLKTPCFYNCTREIGILWRRKWQALIHFPEIIRQMMLEYGNFF